MDFREVVCLLPVVFKLLVNLEYIKYYDIDITKQPEIKVVWLQGQIL
jgi:hypothetical protein